MELMRFQRMWALGRNFDWGFGLLGKYAWPNAVDSDVSTKLFRTRQQARDARKSCCYKDAKVVSVMVTIEIKGKGQ